MSLTVSITNLWLLVAPTMSITNLRLLVTPKVPITRLTTTLYYYHTPYYGLTTTRFFSGNILGLLLNTVKCMLWLKVDSQVEHTYIGGVATNVNLVEIDEEIIELLNKRV